MLVYALLETPKGWVLATSSEKGLVGLSLPKGSRSEAWDEGRIDLSRAENRPEYFASLSRNLICYFSGEHFQFTDRLDFRGATDFQRRVWKATQQVPFGETRSYKWIAEQVGSPLSSRAVGQALGANPLCIVVPCHRVVGVDGQLCGFGGGLPLKRWLLDLEGKTASRKMGRSRSTSGLSEYSRL